MAIYQTERQPERFTRQTGRTGIARMRVIDGPSGRKRIGLYRVDDPVVSAPDAAHRVLDQWVSAEEPSIKLRDLKNGYHIDSYIRQAVDKYAEKVVTAGYDINSEDDEIRKYLSRRLLMMGQAVDHDFPLLLSDIARRFVRDGNVFLVKAYTKTSNPFPGMSLKGLKGRPIIGGFYLLDAERMVPLIDKQTGERKGWIYRAEKGLIMHDKLFPNDQIYHFTYCREGIDDWGHSQIIPAIEDIRSLRAAEEATIKLIYRYLNPLIHVASPDLLDDGEGRQEDVDLVAQVLQQMAHDGFVVTGPGYKISAIGAESQALRADPYLAFFKARGFAGLGVSSLIMGEGNYVGTGGANALSVQMHERARYYQVTLARHITSKIFVDLLLEADIDPFNSEGSDYAALFTFREFDQDEVRKQENHAVDLFVKGALTRTETREVMKRKPLTDEEAKDTYQYIITKLETDAAKAIGAANTSVDSTKIKPIKP